MSITLDNEDYRDELDVVEVPVKVKLFHKDAQIPRKGSADAAGYDLYAKIPGGGAVMIESGETVRVGTGVGMNIPKGYFGGVFARSGLATKKGLRPANAVGVVDADYTGEIVVALHNDSAHNQTIQDGERIAQLVIMPFLPVNFEVVDELDATERGAGGFGSTGSN